MSFHHRARAMHSVIARAVGAADRIKTGQGSCVKRTNQVAVFVLGSAQMARSMSAGSAAGVATGRMIAKPARDSTGRPGWGYRSDPTPCHARRISPLTAAVVFVRQRCSGSSMASRLLHLPFK